jgi:hypothetical protein
MPKKVDEGPRGDIGDPQKISFTHLVGHLSTYNQTLKV